MFRRIVTLLISFPMALVLVTLAVVNRHNVQFALDPFHPDQPALALNLPLYAYIFGAMALGVLAGGVAVWLSQSHWRHTARQRTQDANRWRAEADRLTRERDDLVGSSEPGAKQLALAGR